MALRGLRVIEMAGLAPGPFCGLMLSDFGARVIRVERPNSATFYMDRLARGKESIALNLKDPQGRAVFLDLCSKSDVLIDTFRPGAMEQLKLGPTEVMSVNPSLIFARLSGFGQTGPFSSKAGHDINFLALSGVLSKLGPKDGKPQPPLNLLGDFGAGGLLCAFGILSAVIERINTGKGKILDANITDGTAYLSTWLWRAADLPVWGKGRGDSWLDGGLPFYDTYECRDGKYVAVGCLEKPFFDQLLKGLNLEGKFDQTKNQETLRTTLRGSFKQRDRDDWISHFSDFDACVTPVLTLEEAPNYGHQTDRRSFVSNNTETGNEPRPFPQTLPEDVSSASLKLEEVRHPGQDTVKILKEMGYESQKIEKLLKDGVVQGGSDND